MQQYMYIQDGIVSIFQAETYEKAVAHMKEIGGDALMLQKIKGVQLQHEIAFEVCKSMKELFNQTAKENGIKERPSGNDA